MPCPPTHHGLATRNCSSKSKWKIPSYVNCIRDDLTAISNKLETLSSSRHQLTEDEVREISHDIETSVSSAKPKLTGDLVDVIHLMGQVSKAVSTDKKRKDGPLVSQDALETFANITNDLLSAKTEIWKDLKANEKGARDHRVDKGREKNRMATSGLDLLVAMESLTKSSLKDSKVNEIPIVRETVVIKRGHLRDANDINFPESMDDTLYKEHSKWVRKSKSSVYLSHNAFDNKKSVNYAIILYKNLDKRFSAAGRVAKGRGLEEFEIASEVLSLSINLDNTTLSSDLQLQFSPNLRGKSSPQCVYLDREGTTGMQWTSEHCRTETDANGRVHCSCHHLTNFAVLMRPDNKNRVTDKVLNTISIIGCAVSIFCLTITLVTYALLWTHVKSQRAKLHVCLSSALLLTYLLFLLGIEWTDNKAGCLIVTIVLHYFLLLSFSIMLSEGVELYIQIKIVFSQKPLGWKLYVPAFLGPLLIVGVTLAVTWEKGYRSPHFCWLNLSSGSIWSFFAPIIFVVITNLAIAVIIFRSMLSSYSMGSLENQSRTKMLLRAICVLTPLLGFTWILGFLALLKDVAIFHYSFAVLNSLQGLFIFTFHCVLAKQVRDAAKLRIRQFQARYQMTNSRNNSRDVPVKWEPVVGDTEVMVLNG